MFRATALGSLLRKKSGDLSGMKKSLPVNFKITISEFLIQNGLALNDFVKISYRIVKRGNKTLIPSYFLVEGTIIGIYIETVLLQGKHFKQSFSIGELMSTVKFKKARCV